MTGRRSIIAASMVLAMLITANVSGIAGQEEGSAMQIIRSGTQPSRRGQPEFFTGAVRVDPLASARAPSRVAASYVTFEPGARTAWHTHPLGQTLVVTAGVGWVQQEGGPVEEIRPGDVVWIPPWSEALARRRCHDGNDAHRDHRKSGRQELRVDGKGLR